MCSIAVYGKCPCRLFYLNSFSCVQDGWCVSCCIAKLVSAVNVRAAGDTLVLMWTSSIALQGMLRSVGACGVYITRFVFTGIVLFWQTSLAV